MGLIVGRGLISRARWGRTSAVIQLQLMLYKAKRAFLTEQIIVDEDEHQRSPLYPFNVDFLAQKKKKSQWQPTTPPEIEDKQQIHTEIQGSEDYSQEQFDSYSSQHTVEEQIAQQQILKDAQDRQQTVKQEQSARSFVKTITEGERDAYEFFNESTLRKMNQRLVALKQSFRSMARKYAHNLSVLARQRSELEKLRGQKRKALDYNYELELIREQSKGRVRSLAVCDSIGKVSTMMKKMRYRRVKQAHFNPFDVGPHLSDSRAVDNPMQMSRLLSTRQQVLCKMRQQQNNSQLLQALSQKQGDYLRMIDAGNGQLCKGDVNGLKERIDFLKNELQIKRDMLRLREEEQHLEITALRTQINAMDYKIALIDRDIRAAKLERELRRESGSLTKRALVNYKKKKDSSLMLRMIRPVSPSSITKLSQDCTPTTHSKVKMSFDQSMSSPCQLKQKKQLKYNAYTKYLRQKTTHK